MVQPLSNLSCNEFPALPRAAASTSPGNIIPPQPAQDDMPCTPLQTAQDDQMVLPLTNLSCYEIPASPRAAASTSPGTVIPPQPAHDDLPSIPPQKAEQEQFLDYGKNRFLLNFGLIINFPADNQTCQEHAPGGQKVLGYL